jgi:hypothetical protein
VLGHVGALCTFQIEFSLVQRNKSLLKQRDRSLTAGQQILGPQLAFRITDLCQGKGELMSLMILVYQYMTCFLQILTQQIGCQGKQDADAENALGHLGCVQNHVEKYGQSGTGYEFYEHSHFLDLFG